ncbi:MAG: methionyl-tRNA formyltransferase [Leptothrix sp. (in: b-proteobacteria)]
MTIAYAGTPEFARAALERIAAAGYPVPLVLTQPDRPAGRGMKLQPSPVKQYALEQGFALAQPRSLRLDGKYPDEAAAARAALEAAAPDVLVVAAYGLILPAWVLELPRLGCLNIHGSLLPRWRGAAPIHRAIEAGDGETGITIMQMDEGLDTGDMLLIEREAIRPDDTTATLHDRLAELGARMIVTALDQLSRGALPATRQPAEGVTYAHKIEKAEAPLDWQRPALELARRVRAFDPFPGANFSRQSEVIKAWAAQAVASSGAPGEVLSAGPAGLVVACGEGALALTQLQRPGGRRLGVREFLAACPIAVGERLAN